MIHHNLCHCGQQVSCRLFILTNILQTPSDKGISIMVWNTNQSYQIAASLNFHKNLLKGVYYSIQHGESTCNDSRGCWKNDYFIVMLKISGNIFHNECLSLSGVPVRIYSSCGLWTILSITCCCSSKSIISLISISNTWSLCFGAHLKFTLAWSY